MPKIQKDKKDKIKATFLEILKKNMGIINISCQKANVARSSIDLWRKEDSEFEAAILLAQEAPIDMAESVLFYELRQKNLTAALFVLNKKGGARGYNDKLVVSGDINVTGGVIVLPASMPDNETKDMNLLDDLLKDAT